MKTLDDIKQTLKLHLPLIRARYHITELGIFGSYARGEQREDSDLDLLIDYETAPSLLELIHLENYLADELGIKVEVVTKHGMKPRIRERVLPEVVYVT
jgi:predicted nucleotidyltransferase